MRKIIKNMMLPFAAAAALCGCTIGSSGKTGKELTEFDSLFLTTNDCTAISTTFEIQRTENGIHLSYYNYSEEWNEQDSEYIPVIYPIRELEGDDALYQEIMSCLRQNRVNEWDGFSKSNSEILDGSSFSFTLSNEDGTIVSARGTNSFPKGYQNVYSFISSILTTGVIEDAKLDAPSFYLDVPVSWNNIVTCRYSPNLIFAYINIDNVEIPVLKLRTESNDYYAKDIEKHCLIGTFSSEEEPLYITYEYINLQRYDFNNATPEEQAVFDGLEDFLESISEHIHSK